MLLNAGKSQSYTVSEFLRENLQGGGGGGVKRKKPPPTNIKQNLRKINQS